MKKTENDLRKILCAMTEEEAVELSDALYDWMVNGAPKRKVNRLLKKWDLTVEEAERMLY